MGNGIANQSTHIPWPKAIPWKKYINSICKPIHKLLMVGLDYSGKSTLLYLLAKRAIIDSIPSIGYNT